MTNEEARKFGLNLLRGIMERNESYPVYADNVKQAIEALSDGSSEKPNNYLEGLDEAALEYVTQKKNNWLGDDAWEFIFHAFKAGAEWSLSQFEKVALSDDLYMNK